METLFTAAAVVTAIGVLVKFTPLRRVVLWLWCRNVVDPLTAKADEIVTGVVVRELKEHDTNGSVSLVDLSDHLEKVCDRVDGVQTTVDGLVELGASHTDRLKVLDEHAAELAALNAQGRKDDLAEVASIVDRKAVEEQVGIDQLAVDLAQQKAMLADRAKRHDALNAGIQQAIKADILVEVARDVAEIKRVVEANVPPADQALIDPIPPVDEPPS